MTKVASVRALCFALAIAGSAALTLGACRKGEDPVDEAPLPSPSEEAVAPAADQLRPGELAEGNETAFGLVVPRDLHVVRRFRESTVAVGEPAAELVSNYVRDRVNTSTVEIGPARTVFMNARVRGEEDGKLLRIEVIQQRTRTELVVKDLTKEPIEPGLTEEERWEKAGLSPSGKQLDLKHLH